jgi:hypothetical protein
MNGKEEENGKIVGKLKTKKTSTADEKLSIFVLPHNDAFCIDS